jgi:hypothetical protein
MWTTRKEHTMKRIATVGVAIAAFAAAPAVAAGGNVAQVKPQVTAQVVDVQVANVQRAQVATSLQRHLVQVAHAKRFSLIRAYVR